MELVLTEDQTLLAQSARDFARSTEPLARLRKLRDSSDPLSYSPDVWKRLAELGFTATPFAESDGGLGLGLADVIVITEALGRLLVPEPFIPWVMLGGSAIALSGSDEQKKKFLTPLIEGTLGVALGHEELGSRGNLAHVLTKAEKTPSGYRISGEKTPVLGGAGASAIVVVARTSGSERDRDGLSSFAVPADAPGVAVKRLVRVDSLNAASVVLRDAEVPPSALLGQAGKALPLLETVIDRATVAVCGEMLGGMTEALERTLAYLKEREQFGVKIGTFQALQHRAARLFIEVELTRSAVMAAARAADLGLPQARELVSVAKARASDAFVLVANEAVQMHGGIGMTDEHDIGFFMKRAKAAEIAFGDAAFHRRRFAEIRGF